MTNVRREVKKYKECMGEVESKQQRLNKTRHADMIVEANPMLTERRD